VGFVLGPCLNAAGRLGDAEDALKLLLSETSDSAHEKAVILKEMNDSRKSITEKGVEKALELSDSEKYENDTVLVIYLPDSHESVAGIVAGKVRERTGKPVFILTDGLTSDGEECLKGSGRSIENFNMFEEMTAVKDVFIKYGGHAMAAGLSLSKDKLSEFRERINKNSSLSKEDLAVKIKIDMELPLSFVSFDLVRDIQRLEPCGTENEKPVFAARDITIRDLKVLGANRNVLKGRAEDLKGGRVDCVYFGTDAEDMKDFIEERERSGESLKILYSPGINEFRGSETLQIILEGIK
jgi:single-stranded-DNA-specific exonuclease